jgi:hypothetical protein
MTANRRCFCITKVETAFAKQGEGRHLNVTIPIGKAATWDVERVVLTTYVSARTDKKRETRRHVELVADFCPFCGKRYPRKPLDPTVALRRPKMRTKTKGVGRG